MKKKHKKLEKQVKKRKKREKREKEEKRVGNRETSRTDFGQQMHSSGLPRTCL